MSTTIFTLSDDKIRSEERENLGEILHLSSTGNELQQSVVAPEIAMTIVASINRKIRNAREFSGREVAVFMAMFKDILPIIARVGLLVTNVVSLVKGDKWVTRKAKIDECLDQIECYLNFVLYLEKCEDSGETIGVSGLAIESHNLLRTKNYIRSLIFEELLRLSFFTNSPKDLSRALILIQQCGMDFSEELKLLI